MTDRGSVTIWMLGLTLIVLAFGGLAVDFWRALALQRELAAIADSAAIAAASGIDEEVYRSTGDIVLATDRANRLARESVAFQAANPDDVTVTVGSTSGEVTVEVSQKLQLGLLALLIGDAEPIRVRASASAVPTLVP